MSQPYLWPTDSGQYLSSTFGETRSAHFHAGLDIKTWGQEGYRVFASRDGILHRLLITERGYGKAIYLQHADSSYTVYAHLQRFNDNFQHIADSIRMQDHSFEMDEALSSQQIKVKQGDVIGYTGSTGIGPPHLHFEIRDASNNPINALTKGLEVKDEIPPVFSSLIVEPLSHQSRVNGSAKSLSKRAQKKDGSFDFGTISISGEAGLAVNVYDQADEVYNAYAVYSLTLMHESDTLFHQLLNEIDFEYESEMFLDRIAPFGSARRGHQRLYGKEGHNNPFYLIEKQGAILTPPEVTSANYTIIASDYFGNRSTATIKIVPDSTVSDKPISMTSPPDAWYWHEDWVSPDLMNSIDLKKGFGGFPWDTDQEIMLSDSSVSKAKHSARISPETQVSLKHPSQRMQLYFPKNSVFDTLSTLYSYDLKNDTIALSIHPQMLPLKQKFGVQFYLGDHYKKGNKYRLFRKRSSNGSLSYVESELKGRSVLGYPSEMGEFVIIPDNDPPEVTNFRVHQTDYGMWQIRADVEDSLSGINSESAQFKVNGVRGIAEYDYEEEIITYYHPDFKPISENKVLLIIEDKAGNKAEFEVTLPYPD